MSATMTIQAETQRIREELTLQTAQIRWQELQRFFAKGSAVSVSAELDLIEVAYQFTIDNKNQVAQWLTEQKLAKVSNEQARLWLQQDALVWAVVVKPWLLVQTSIVRGE
jgi:hypothetical protein